MLAFTLFRPDLPVLTAPRVTLREPKPGDYREWAAVRQESRDFLARWEPRWAEDELERASWRERIRRYRGEIAAGTALPYLIFETATGRLAGGITLGNIRHGVAQSGQIGYWMGVSHAGRGLMPEAVTAVARHAFEQLRLHRIEAACIPDNERSIRVLEKAGFKREGLLRSYLRINGAWEDHYLYSLVSADRGIEYGQD
ncbi:MAG: GNAT family protein [Mesorhizobium sp.]